MKYGCGTTIDNYSILQDLGFDYIELPGNQISKMTDEEFDALKTVLENGSVKCCGFNAALTPDIVITGEGYDLEKPKPTQNFSANAAANYIFPPLASAPPNPGNFRKAMIWKKHGKKQKHS